MRSAVTVSLVPESRGGPFVYWDGLTEACFHAAALGFDAIEIFPPSAAAIDPAQLRPLLARHRLAVAAVGTGAGWVVRKWTLTHPDAAIRKRAREFIRAIIDLAADFHAPAIIGSMQGRAEGGVDRAQALNWLGEALDELGAHAATRGTVLLLEPLNRYETNLCNRLGDTAAWLDQRGADSVRLLADLFHMAIEEADPAAALRAAGHRIGHIHFADSNRWAMGLGHTDPAIRSQAREFVRSIIDLAAGFNAPAIIGSLQGRAEGGVDRPQALAWLGQALDDLGAHAGSKGTFLLLEPLNRYETNLCNRLGDTAAWLDQRGVESVRLLADLFHMAIEEADLAAALRAAGHRIGHVHFADSNRRAMGMGHTDPAPIIAALRQIGYTGFLSAEVLPLPDSAAAARQTIASLRRCLQAR